MRVLTQRVIQAAVHVAGQVSGQIQNGLLVFLGIEEEDSLDDVQWLVRKLTKLRIFADESGAMNLSLADVEGELLVVSQFTLHASTRKGNRPSFIKAARPEKAKPLYENFIHYAQLEIKTPVRSGEFGANMQVSLINDGPVTIWMDSKNRE